MKEIDNLLQISTWHKQPSDQEVSKQQIPTLLNTILNFK